MKCASRWCANLRRPTMVHLLASSLPAVVLALAGTQPAAAQLSGNAVPGVRYFIGVEEIYEGNLRNAERLFRRELNRGIQFGANRWVDSVCYHAMLGEVLYRMGRNAEALAAFDQACQYFLQTPNWLLSVKFPDPIRAEAIGSRRSQPPWGRSERQALLGQFPSTMLVMKGRIQTVEEIKRQRITVVEPPQYFKLEVPEIIRCTALALRRRNQILGPLGKYDSLSKDLAGVFGAGGLTQPNHWSSAWVELQLGLAQIGIGNIQEAHTHLNRALVADGRFDHPLTCVVLLEQGRLALEAGNAALAARLLAEASFSAFYFDNWNVVEEALRLGQVNHLVVSGPGVFPPLDQAAQWSRRRGLDLLTASFRNAQAENLVVLRQTEAAATTLTEASRWIRDGADGQLGIRQLYVQALLAFQQARIDEGHDAIKQATVRQLIASPRGFQLQLTNRLFDGTDGGRITSRAATNIYEALLADPSPEQWALDPLDALALLQSPHTESYDRWFLAALDRKDVQMAMEIAEKAKRRRFHAALPWAGRLLALRTVLESMPGELNNAAALQRQQILIKFPVYEELSTAGLATRRALDKLPILAANQADFAELAELYEHWERTAIKREALLRELGLRREPATIQFPPMPDVTEIQQSLASEEVLVLFHTVAGQMHGFLLTSGDYHAWRVGRASDLNKSIGELLRAIGNYGPGRNMTVEQLADDSWKNAAQTIYRQIFGDSRLAIGQTARMAIVPDDVLWYVPFEMLLPGGADGNDMLVDRALIRYAPLAGLAVAHDHPLRRVRHTGIVANNVGQVTADGYVDVLLDQLATTVTGPVRLPLPLPAPAELVAARLDQLISFDDIQPVASQPLDWFPLPKDRGRGTGTLADMLAIPLGGPERVMLVGLTTRAESGLKGASRREARDRYPPGSEIFHATCALAANGTRTALLSRWRTGGQTNLELTREFVQELPHLPADEAWQRSVLLARSVPLDSSREPRLTFPDRLDVAPKAEHPFFWAGYLLLDNAGDPRPNEVEPPEDEPVVRVETEAGS